MSNRAAEWYAEQEQRERVKAAATESEQAAEYWLKRAATMHRNAVEALNGGLRAEDLRAADLTGETAQAIHAAAERMRRGEERITMDITGACTVYEQIVEITEREMMRRTHAAELALASKPAPIIAVDFDGTLCEQAWPGIGAERWPTIQALLAAQAAGARLILWTNRVGARLREAVEWCRQHELEFDAVNENLPEVLERFTTNPRKVYADIYLDDKAAQPSAAVLGALWDTARSTMNGEEPQAYNPTHRGTVTAEQFETIWNDDTGEEEDDV